MSPILVSALVGLIVILVAAANPGFQVWVRTGLGMMREERVLKRTRSEAPGITLDDYHRAVVGTGASTKDANDLTARVGSFRTPIDDRTWADLDLDQVFVGVDFTSSRPGQQYLRHLLRTPAQTTQPLTDLNRAIEELGQDVAANTAIKNALLQCDDPRASFLAGLFFGVLPDRPRFWWIFPLLTLSALTLAVLSFVWPRALLGLLAIAVTNILLQLFYRPRVEALIPAIHEVPAFLKTAKTIGALRTDLFAAERETLAQGASQLGLLSRATTWLKFEPSQQSNELLASLYAYVNLLLLLDMTAFVFAIDSAKRLRPTLQGVFDTLGYIDAAQSIAEWRKTLASWSVPVFTTTRKEIHVAGLVHPLVKNAVANSVTIKDGSALITGSNMSGKTTFIRALGVNAILAQSLSTVVATRWCAPLLATASSIGRADSVLEGRSYYLAEVESIRALIQQKGDGAQHLFLIDELFRGTNTAERVAGAYAVLEYLNRGDDIVVIATHDTELLSLLGEAYAPHHFREEITGDNLTFDFILRDGQATTRNAIALLELMKYPAEIVTRARNALR